LLHHHGQGVEYHHHIFAYHIDEHFRRKFHNVEFEGIIHCRRKIAAHEGACQTLCNSQPYVTPITLCARVLFVQGEVATSSHHHPYREYTVDSVLDMILHGITRIAMASVTRATTQLSDLASITFHAMPQSERRRPRSLPDLAP
jgi:hypothetical protein